MSGALIDLMSGGINSPDKDPNTPEGQAWLAAQKPAWHFLASSLSRAPSSVLGSVIPAPGSSIPGVGAADLLYGFGNSIFRGLQHTTEAAGSSEVVPEGGFNPLTSRIDTNQPVTNLPFAEDLHAKAEAARSRALEVVPPMTPDNPAERIGQGGVDMIASFGVPGTGALVRGTGLFPAAVRTLQPGMTAGPISTAVFGGMGAGLEAAIPGSSRPPEPAHPTDVIDPTTLGVDTHDPNAPLVIRPPENQEIHDLVHANDTPYTWGDAATALGITAATIGGFAAHRAFRSAAIERSIIARTEHTAAPIIEAYDTASVGMPHSSGRISTENLPSVPLPARSDNPVIDAGKKVGNTAITQFVNKSNTINNLIEFHAINATEAEILKAKIGLYSNDAFRNQRKANIALSGYDTETGTAFPSIVDLHREVGSASEADRILYDEAAHARDELDNRRRIPAQTQVGGQDTGVNLPNTPTSQLEAISLAASYNSTVNKWLNTRQAINRGLIQMAERSGMLSPAERLRLENAHPNFMSSASVDGVIENPFRSRSLTVGSGGDANVLPVWERDKQHHDIIIDAIQRNDANRLILDTVYASQDRNPKLAKLFTPSINRAAEDPLNAVGNTPFIPNQVPRAANPAMTPLYVQNKEGTAIAIRRNGVLEWHNVNNPTIRKMFNESVEHNNQLMKAGSLLAQFANSNTTQLGAALVAGHVFAPTQLGYVGVRALLTRPPGTATGYLDKAVQHITGGRLALPGLLDPTAAAGPVIGVMQNMHSRLMQGLTQAIGPNTTGVFRRILEAQFGKAWTDALHYKVQRVAENTAYALMQEAGATHASGFLGVVPTTELGAKTSKYSPITGMAPELHLPDSILPGNVVLKANKLAHAVMAMIADGEHTFFYGLNRSSAVRTAHYGNEKTANMVLAHQTRNLAGDPATRGSNETLNSWNKLGQYGNVIIQDIANASKAVYNNPFQTGLNVASVIGIPALFSVYSAIAAGPNSVRHMFQELTSGQGSAELSIYGGDDQPDSRAKIQIPQTERVVIAVAKQLAFDILDAQQMSKDPDFLRMMHKTMQELLGRHITQNTIDGLIAGANTAITSPVPVGVNAMTALTMNRTMKIEPVDVAVHGINPRTTMNPVGHVMPPLPGIAKDANRNNDAGLMDHFSHALAAVSGIAGHAGTEMWKAINQTQARTGSIVDGLQSAGSIYTRNLRESLPIANSVVWKQPALLASQTPIDRYVNDSVNKLRPLLSIVSDVRNEGLTSGRGAPIEIAPGQQEKVPTDPTMAYAYHVAAQMGKKVINGPFAPYAVVEDLRKRMANLAESGRPPDEIRVMHNQLTRSLHNQMSIVNQDINDINDAISAIIGQSTNLNTIDWYSRDPKH